jgi:hypothetical protein
VEKPMFSGYRCDASDVPSEEPIYDVHL